MDCAKVIVARGLIDPRSQNYRPPQESGNEEKKMSRSSLGKNGSRTKMGDGLQVPRPMQAFHFVAGTSLVASNTLTIAQSRSALKSLLIAIREDEAQ